MLLHSNENFVFSIAQVFRNIHFLLLDKQSSQLMRCALFQINTDLLLLVIYQNINISTQKTLTLSFISKNKLALLIANFFRNIQFLPHFLLLLTVNEICNISNEYCLFDKSAKEIFNTRDFAPFLRFKKNALTISEAFTNIHFFHIFTNFHGE